MPMRDNPRFDVQQYELTGGFRVEIYTRSDKYLQGYSMSLHYKLEHDIDLEVARWDFEPGKAHVHWQLGNQPRLYYPKHWPLSKILTLACHELKTHTRAWCGPIGIPKPAKDELIEAAAWATTRLLVLNRGTAI